MRGESEAGDRRAGRTRLELQAHEGQERLRLARGRGKHDRARVAPVGVELQGELQAPAGEPLRLEAPGQPLESRVSDEEKGLERDERPLEIHPFTQRKRRQARLERARVDSARGGVKPAPELPQAALDLSGRQFRELSDRADAPPLEGCRDLDLRREACERQRREKFAFLPRRHDTRRIGQSRRDARGELGGGEAGARGQAGLFDGGDQVLAEEALVAGACSGICAFRRTGERLAIPGSTARLSLSLRSRSRNASRFAR